MQIYCIYTYVVHATFVLYKSYEMYNSLLGAKYKFRIGVVFENDLPAVSKSSPKFTLTSEAEMLAPTAVPVLQKAMPISPSAIEIFWEVIVNKFFFCKPL